MPSLRLPDPPLGDGQIVLRAWDDGKAEIGCGAFAAASAGARIS